MTFFEKIWNFFGGHVHNRRTFLAGNIAFVKCMDYKCAEESIPWEVTKEIADQWHSAHPDAILDAIDVDKKRKEWLAKRKN